MDEERIWKASAAVSHSVSEWMDMIFNQILIALYVREGGREKLARVIDWLSNLFGN